MGVPAVLLLLLAGPLLAVTAAASAAAADPPDPPPVETTACSRIAPYALLTSGSVGAAGVTIDGPAAIGGVARFTAVTLTAPAPAGADVAAPTALTVGRSADTDGLVDAAAGLADVTCNEPVARCVTTTAIDADGVWEVRLTANGTTNDVECAVSTAALRRARVVRLVGTAPYALFIAVYGETGDEAAALRLTDLRVEGVTPRQTLWVACGVTQVVLNRADLKGGLLAPRAAVRATRSSVAGTVVAASLKGQRFALGGPLFDCASVVPGRET